jgi:hypothetical protein
MNSNNPNATGDPIARLGHQPDPQRRRFVRGAAAIAPVVLTLRSGAVAAASCTGAKLITQLDHEGQSPNATITGNTTGLVNGDSCFTSPNVCEVEGAKVSGGVPNGTVQINGPNVVCTGGTNYYDGQQVAILSAVSASSLLGRTV